MTAATAVRVASDASASTTNVYTGSEFLDSIRDGREIYIYGERVKDVTKHPAFRNSARMVARWYDRFHEKKDEIGVPTDTGSGQMTHPFFLGSKTTEDLVRGRDAIAELQKVSFGWMGRSPDYKASFLGTLGRHELYERNYAGNYENLRVETLMAATATGDLGAMQDFVRPCMGDYDLSGWTAKDLINPDDINLISRGMVQG